MKTLDINQIKQYLPHRYPMLLVDRVLEWESGKSITAIKNVTANEEFFNGHFPNKPVMPGVLMVEASKQVYAPTRGGLAAVVRRPLRVLEGVGQPAPQPAQVPGV